MNDSPFKCPKCGNRMIQDRVEKDKVTLYCLLCGQEIQQSRRQYERRRPLPERATTKGR